MTKVVLRKVNEVWDTIECEESIAHELSDFFTFEVPNSQFRKKGNLRYWDGKIKLFDKRRKRLPGGLRFHLGAFIKERGYQLEQPESLTNLWDNTTTEAFAKSLKLTSGGKAINLHEHQAYGITKAVGMKRVTLESPTNSGKSLIAYVVSRLLISKGLKGLIIVPSIQLVEQMYLDFEDYSSANGWKVEKFTHRIYGGQDRRTDKSLVISTWQSLLEMMDSDYPTDFLRDFDFVFGDEAHGYAAKSLEKIMHQLTRASYRIGMSGTIQDEKVHRLQIVGHFGPVVKVATNKELMDKGISADLKVGCILLKYGPEESRLVSKMTYQDEMQYLAGHKGRNNFIANLALSRKGNVLVLFQFIEKHGKILEEIIRIKNTTKKKVFFIYGGTELEDRLKMKEIVEKETDCIILASYGALSTGVSIKNIQGIIFASPYKSKIKVLQSIGRGLRVSETKKSIKLYNVADDFRYEDKLNKTLEHYLARMEIYRKERFKVEVFKVSL